MAESVSYFQGLSRTDGMAGELLDGSAGCLMNSKILQFPPEGHSRMIRIGAVPKQWSVPAGYSPDIGFFQSWLENDTISDRREAPGTNWGAISGLALSVVVSASFWFGAVLLIERLLK